MKTTRILASLGTMLVLLFCGSLSAQTHPMGQQDPAASGFTEPGAFGTIDLNIGWRFKCNANDVVVTRLGCNYPSGTPAITVTLFDATSQAVLAQEVCGPGSGWQFNTLANPIPLTQGSEYVITSLLVGTVGCYYHPTPPASWVPTGDIQLLDNVFEISSSANTFPAQSTGTTQYGVVDFGYADGLVITAPTQLPAAGELTTYNEVLSATNGTTPYSWSLLSGNLPTGMSLSASGDNYVLSGTPATGTSGTYNFTLQATDAASATTTKALSLTVNGLLISSDEAPEGIAGAAYSEDLTAENGQTPYTWSLVSGTLPQGLNLAPVGNVFRLSGTPAFGTNGLYTFDVRVTDNLNATVTETITLFIKWPTGTDLYPLTQQDPVTSGFTDFNTYGSFAKWGWKFRVNATGVSVLRLGANFKSNAAVTIAIFDVATQSLIVSGVVGQGSGWRFANLATPVDLTAGKEYLICGDQAISTTGYYAYNLPTSWKPTGDIEYLVGVADFYSTAPAVNTYPVNTVTDRMGGVVDFGFAKVLNISTEAALPAATEQVAYTTNIQATAGSAPYTWSMQSGVLPSGLSLTQVGSDYQLAGTPATGTPGSYAFTVKVTDSVGFSRTRTMQIAVAWPANQYFYPMTRQDPMTTGFTNYNTTSTTPYQWGYKFKVNTAGLTVMRLGANFPNQATTPHVVTLFDVATQSVLAQATCGTGTGWQFTELFSPVALVDGAEYVIAGLTGANYYYHTSLPTSWKPTGDIQYLNGQGTSSGPPTANTFPTSIYSNRLYGVVDFGYVKSLSVTTPAALPRAAEQASYTLDIEADFGSTPYTWSTVSGTLPAGLSLVTSGDDYRLSGTPATGTTGQYMFAVKVVDSLNKSHTKVMTLDVLPQSATLPFTDDFSADLGWQYGTDWTRGAATAYSATGPNRSEPGSDHSSSSDNMIAGHRIGADYAANMQTTDWLTSPPFNCTGTTIVSLRYYRWFGSSQGHTHKVQVTTNGITWHDVWSAPAGTNLNDTAWTLVAHDISQWAAGNPVVQVRFGTGPTGSIVNTGWCIDDVLILEPPPELEVREGGLTGTIITDNEPVGGLRDFGQVNPGVSSPVLTISLTNNGLNTITFQTWSKTGVNPGDFFVLQSPSASLAPNMSTSMQIQFYSTVVGVKTAMISLPHNAVGSGTTPFEINLRGESIVLAPSIQVDLNVSGGVNIPHQAPAAGTARDFGNVVVGGISSSITIAITNTGNGPLTVQSIDVGGTWWTQFAANPGPIPPSLAAGASMTFTVAFQPTSPGVKAAYVRIYHDDGTQPSAYEVHVTGNATAANPQVGVSDGSPLNHNDPAAGARDFGSVLVGSTSVSATITVSNSGSASLIVGAVTLGGPNAAEFSVATAGFSTTILASGSSSFEIRFAPMSVGAKTATVSFTHNDPGVPSPFLVNVTGNGVLAAPVIEVRETNAAGAALANPAPATGILDFGTQDVSAGASAAAVIFVRNAGTSVLTLGTPTVQSAVTGAFVLNTTGFPGSLAIGASATFSVAFDPAQAGTFSGTIEFTHNDTATVTPYVLNVTGNGAAAEVQVREGSVAGPVVASGDTATAGGGRDCGSINVSAGATGPITIVLQNTGTLSLALGLPTLAGANAADFGISSTGMSTSLAPGASTSFTVTFDPTLGGIKNAEVVFTHNDPVNPSPFVVPVTGTAIDPNGVRITTLAVPTGISGSIYPTTQLTAEAGSQPYTWSVFSGNLPNGLSLSADGVLSGTPNSYVTLPFNFTIRVADAAGATAEQQFTMTVVGADLVSRARGGGGCVAAGDNLGGVFLLLIALLGLAVFRKRQAR